MAHAFWYLKTYLKHQNSQLIYKLFLSLCQWKSSNLHDGRDPCESSFNLLKLNKFRQVGTFCPEVSHCTHRTMSRKFIVHSCSFDYDDYKRRKVLEKFSTLGFFCTFNMKNLTIIHIGEMNVLLYLRKNTFER